MALTTRHVASDGVAAWADSTSSDTPCSLSTAVANASAGSYIKIKSGTYVRGASDTVTADGTVASPIIWCGCDTSWNPITPVRNSDNLLLTTTDMPYLDYTGGNYKWAGSGSDYAIYQSLRIASATTDTTAALHMGISCIGYGCSVTATANDADAKAIQTGNTSVLLGCDAACTGASSSTAIYVINGCMVMGCYVTDSASYGINMANTNALVLNNVISGCADWGIYYSFTSGRFMIINNTIFGKGIGTANYSYAAINPVIGNHITNSSTYGFSAPHISGSSMLFAYNRLRDNATADISCVGDWTAATSWAHVTETAGGGDAAARNAAEFVSSGGTPANFNLKYGAAAIGANFMKYMDIGGLQMALPTFPIAAHVIDTASAYGPVDTPISGTFEVPAESNVKKGVNYGSSDEFEGEFTGESSSACIV
jgi:hypothetical protein